MPLALRTSDAQIASTSETGTATETDRAPAD
jgi:hypothetical protein